MQQQTIQNAFTLSGIGLHTGAEVHVHVQPAPADAGIVFVRSDLPGKPRVEARLENLHQQMRCTTLKQGNAEVITTEHLLATCYALQLDNLLVEMDGQEMPGIDGSALPFYQALSKAGVQRQAAEAKELVLRHEVQVGKEKALLRASSYDKGLKIEYVLEHDVAYVPAQYLILELSAEKFAREIAPARTFVLKREVEHLRSVGLGKGANTHNTLVIAENGTIIENTLRFPDEFVRHKVLDLIGDLALLGARLKAFVSASRSGHQLNAELVREIAKTQE
jgi:UDP-3-O-[3-hydroxymyristoyl] N-acetylglucosamine deacetylase